MLRDLHLVADDEVAADTNLVRELVRRQLGVLVHRHPAEDLILVRVLCEEYQHGAMLAKTGRPAQARRHLVVLDTQVPHPDDPELVDVLDVAREPAWALVDWIDGDTASALRRLDDALAACERLAGDLGHDYLAGKQVHLAVNVARVRASCGETQAAVSLLEALRQVVDGDVAPWPYAGATSLRVPLEGMERTAMVSQIESTATRLQSAPR